MEINISPTRDFVVFTSTPLPGLAGFLMLPRPNDTPDGDRHQAHLENLTGRSFVKATYLSRRKPDKNLPALKQLAEGESIQTICAEVEAAFTGQARLARSIQMYLCQKYARMKLKDIGAYFGVGQSGVCQAARRVTRGNENGSKAKKKNRRDGKTFPIVNNEDLTLYLLKLTWKLSGRLFAGGPS